MNRGWKCALGAGGMAAVLLTAVSAAAAPAKLTIRTDVRLGYDINPFLAAGKDLASGYAEVVVSPQLSKKTAAGEVALSGYFDDTRFFQKYGNSAQYGGELRADRRISPKLRVFGALRYDSEVIGQGGSTDELAGGPDNTDVNLIGLRRRSNTFAANGGWEYRLTPKDTISADGGITDTRYARRGGVDSRNIGGRVGWKHAISPRTKVGLSGSVYYIDYDTPGLKTLIMEPDVTFSTELKHNWTFNAAIGISFSKLYLPLPLLDGNSKGLSGSIDLCHKGARDTFCLNAARSISGSGAGGTTVRTQVGVNYRRRLTEQLSWAGSANYTRSRSQSNLLGTREYVSARGGFDWLANRWLTLGVDGRYRDVFGGRQIRADYGGEASATIFFPKRP